MESKHHVYVCDLRRGFELLNGFIDHLYTRIGITISYSATANLQNSQITTATAKPFQLAVSYQSFPGNDL
jgi:hypothetical protein